MKTLYYKNKNNRIYEFSGEDAKIISNLTGRKINSSGIIEIFYYDFKAVKEYLLANNIKIEEFT